MELIRRIKSYIPVNEQEMKDKEYILSCLEINSNIFTRDNEITHMTASAWVVNKERTKVLMAYHKIYDSWAWLGGHADGEKDLLAVALKEAREESGISEVTPVTEEIFSLEVLPVSGHIKKGKYISSHIHLNVTYLLEADEESVLTVKEDENSAVGWFTFAEALKASTEPWFVENIYRKLIEKLVKVDSEYPLYNRKEQKMNFTEIAKKRQSCRNYDENRIVEEEKLQAVLDAARLAPSACNGQPYFFTVCHGETAKQVAKATQEAGMNKFATQAPVMIVISEMPYVKTAAFGAKVKGNDYRSIDIGIAAAYLTCEATAQGLDTCILGWLNEKKIREICGIEGTVRLVISLGYAKEGDKLRDKKRKDMDDLVKEI